MTHWSSCLLARQEGVSHSTIARIWRAYGIKPHQLETLRSPPIRSQRLKSVTLSGVCMDPPEDAVVLCVDEKSQVQALDRTQPMLPVRPRLAARRAHDVG